MRVSSHVFQALQAELRGAAERVDALLAFGEGLAERSEPRAWASLEQVLRALGTHRDTSLKLMQDSICSGRNHQYITIVLCSPCIRRKSETVSILL